MANYSNHPYGKLLTHIENGCQQLKEERDYVGYLLSMERAESIEKLIKIYNNIFKLLAYIFYGNLNFPYYWYHPETWGKDNCALAEDLNCFLNENILKWYQRQGIATEQQGYLCLSNLRESENAEDIQNQILERYARFHKDEDEKISPLLPIIQSHYSQLKQIATKSIKTGMFDSYISCSKVLAGHGRIFDVVETQFGEDYKISYEGLAKQYKKEIELAAKKKLSETKKKDKTKSILTLLILVIILVALIWILSKIGIFGIIIIIGFIGLVPKIFLTLKL